MNTITTGATTATLDDILFKHGIVFPAVSRNVIDKFKAALSEALDHNPVVRAGRKAARLLKADHDNFQAWDDQSHASHVQLMATEVSPFLATDEAKTLIFH